MISADLVSAFEDVSERHKERIAVTSPGKRVRYGELNQQAGKLANHLLSGTDRSDHGSSRVALLMGHDTDMVAAILGVLKAGMTYITLDPSYPGERLSAILTDCQAGYLVTDGEHLALGYELIYASRAEITLVDISELPDDTPVGKTQVSITDQSEAYIMYTSGSTGKPKGVFQSYRNILAITRCFSGEIDIDPQDRILLTTPFNHTVSAIDMFCALLNGAALCLYDVRKHSDKHALLRWIAEQEISIIHTVPTLFRYMLGEGIDKTLLSGVRLVVLGGEDVLKNDFALYRDNFSDDCMFINLYGQSEVIIAAMQVLDKGSSVNSARVPMGLPLDIIQTKVISDQSASAQVLEEGELVVTGDYITSGYVNAENPSRIVTGADGKRILYTGDTVRRLPDGCLEFTGRKDAMVKISGNRVDLFEIEAHLNESRELSRSVVLYHDHQLTAFYETVHGSPADAKTLKAVLRKKMPDYMVPAQFVHLDQVPVTPNGKTDRQALLALALKESAPAAEALNETELALQAIWKSLFQVETISIHDNFFQLGGNSLLATEMVNKVFLELECELELHTIFDNQTIHELARAVDAGRVVLN